MKLKLQVESCRLQVLQTNLPARSRPTFNLQPSTFNCRRAFTLVEVMVVMVLLALIVVALMAVFHGTQTAFRAGITQTDVLESGRATIELMTEDLREMSPSLGTNNGAVNFAVIFPSGYTSLAQSLVASSQTRTNVLEDFFVLSRGNLNGVPTWYGSGYAVVPLPPGGALYSLYRFSTNLPAASADAPVNLFTNFLGFYNAPTNYDHLMDGVVELRVRAFDTNGAWINSANHDADNTAFVSPIFGETGFYMFSNTLPAAVEVELGALEDRTLQRAESLPDVAPVFARSNYLANAAGQVHIFRQRVSIPNVDPSAYQ